MLINILKITKIQRTRRNISNKTLFVIFACHESSIQNLVILYILAARIRKNRLRWNDRCERYLPKFTDLAPRFYIYSQGCPTHGAPIWSTIILSMSSKQAYKTAGHIWGGARGKGTRGAACAVHRPSRPPPLLTDKNPFREWNMWETGPPRGIILNYVCPHLSAGAST